MPPLPQLLFPRMEAFIPVELRAPSLIVSIRYTRVVWSTLGPRGLQTSQAHVNPIVFSSRFSEHVYLGVPYMHHCPSRLCTLQN